LKREGRGAETGGHTSHRSRPSDDEDASHNQSFDGVSGGSGGKFEMTMNLKKLGDIKSRINTGLANADGSKNSRIIKQ